MRLRRYPEGGIENNPQGISSLDQADPKVGIISDNGPYSDKDGVMMSPQPVRELQRGGRAYPLGMARRRSDPPVKGLCVFQRDKGNAGSHEREKLFVQRLTLPLQDSHLHPYSVVSQYPDALPGDKGIGINVPYYHP